MKKRTVTFEIHELENGYLVYGNAKWHENNAEVSRGLSNGVYVPNLASFAKVLQDLVYEAYK